MELQFQKSVCKYLTCPVREVQNAELTQEIRLSDGMPDIGRVLTSWGQVIVRSKEWRGDVAIVSGGLLVWVLYAPEDGGDPRSVDGWIPFQLTWNLPPMERDGVMRVWPLLRFVDGRNISARKIMVRAGVGAMGEALCPAEADVYTPQELPEDIEVLNRTYPVRIPKETGEKSFYMDEDLTAPTAAAPQKILSYTAAAHVQEKKVVSGRAVMRGTTDVHVVYRDQEGKIRVYDTPVPFSQYVDLESEYGPDAQADVQMCITNMELDLNDQGQMRLKCGLLAQYLIDDRELINVAEDAYSPRREVSVMVQPLHLPAMLEKRQETLHARQKMSGQQADVLDAVCLPDFPRCVKSQQGVNVQLSGVFQMLCAGDEGLLRSGTCRWENQVELPCAADVNVSARIVPDVAVHAMAEGEDMVLSSRLELQIQSASETPVPMVSAIETGELREDCGASPAVILCRPEGETLWNIAKRCGSTVSAIRNSNGLQEEPVDNRMLLIPVY